MATAKSSYIEEDPDFTGFLLELCTALSQRDNDEQILATLLDLNRELRRERRDPRKECTKLLGKFECVDKDLLPLLLEYGGEGTGNPPRPWSNDETEARIRIEIIRLLCNLTFPLPPPSEEEEGEYEIVRIEIGKYQATMKSNFIVHSKCFGVMARMIGDCIAACDVEKETEEMQNSLFGSRAAQLLVELLVALLRNLLQIDDGIDLQQRNGAKSSSFQHRDLVFILEKEKIIDGLILLSQEDGQSGSKLDMSIFRPFLAEIFYLIFRKYSPVALVYPQADHPSLPKCYRSFNERVENEKKRKQSILCRVKIAGRHPRWGGTFCYKKDDGTMISFNESLADRNESKVGDSCGLGSPPPKSAPLSMNIDMSPILEERDPFRLLLLNAASSIIHSCFNTLIDGLRKDVLKPAADRVVFNSDKMNLMWIISWFSWFHLLSEQKRIADLLHQKKHKDNDVAESDNETAAPAELEINVGFIANAIDIDTFKWVSNTLSEYSADASHSYKAFPVCIAAIRSMMLVVDAMYACKMGSHNYEVARVLLANIFHNQYSYFPGELHKLMKQMRPDAFLQSRNRNAASSSLLLAKSPTSNYLSDLLETIHITMRLMQMCAERDHLMVIKSHVRRAVTMTVGVSFDGESDFGTKEELLDVDEYTRKFASPSIIRNLVFLLSQYNSNSEATNHHIAKLCHRIAFKLGYEAMFFQVSVLFTFERFLKSPVMNESSSYRELRKMVESLVRKFARSAQTDPNVFVEALFWKSKRSAEELKYVILERERNPKSKEITRKRKRVSTVADRVWTEEEINEMASTFDRFKDMKDPFTTVAAMLSFAVISDQVARKIVELGKITEQEARQLDPSVSLVDGEQSEEEDEEEENYEEDDNSFGLPHHFLRAGDLPIPVHVNKIMNLRRKWSGLQPEEIGAGEENTIGDVALKWAAHQFERAIKFFSEPSSDGKDFVLKSASGVAFEKILKDRAMKDVLLRLGAVQRIPVPGNSDGARRREKYWVFPGFLKLETAKQMLDELREEHGNWRRRNIHAIKRATRKRTTVQDPAPDQDLLLDDDLTDPAASLLNDNGNINAANWDDIDWSRFNIGGSTAVNSISEELNPNPVPVIATTKKLKRLKKQHHTEDLPESDLLSEGEQLDGESDMQIQQTPQKDGDNIDLDNENLIKTSIDTEDLLRDEHATIQVNGASVVPRRRLHVVAWSDDEE